MPNPICYLSYGLSNCTATEKRVARLPAAVKAVRSLHILLAEDNAVNQRLAVRLLEKQSHAVVVLDTSKAAVAALEREAFDLVVG
ncbi:MAG TPA: hypothetical protein VK395_22125 [Gemmataceae bacterium]|nr:hypothetical protein [Gemmataceae bacterium]